VLILSQAMNGIHSVVGPNRRLRTNPSFIVNRFEAWPERGQVTGAGSGPISGAGSDTYKRSSTSGAG
jgi:hypothetical protein